MEIKPEDWLIKTDMGLYNAPGDFYIDPMQGVNKAIISHGHADHARPGHNMVWATSETLAIMETRYGSQHASTQFPLIYSELVLFNEVKVYTREKTTGLAPWM